MVLHRKRRLFLGLGVTVTLGLVVVLPPAAAAVSTLTGQTLNGSSSSANSPTCPAPTYSVSGTASGPYPGTFDESGTWNFEELTSGTFGPATFAITSGRITISGSKSGRGVGFRECAIPGRGGGADLSLAPIAY